MNETPTTFDRLAEAMAKAMWEDRYPEEQPSDYQKRHWCGHARAALGV